MRLSGKEEAYTWKILGHNDWRQASCDSTKKLYNVGMAHLFKQQ